MIMRAKAYSLWLMPTGEVYNKFSDLIRRLAMEYSSPIFEPHVTLLGELMQSEEDIIRKTGQLAEGKEPFPVTLTTIDYQDFYFRALFVKVEETEPLILLHNRTKEVFGMQNIQVYMPHLSLLYGNFPQTAKERIIEGIGRNHPAQFTVNNIHLFKTGKQVNTWYKVKEFPFG